MATAPRERANHWRTLRVPTAIGLAGVLLLSACGAGAKAGRPPAAAKGTAAPNPTSKALNSNLPLEEQLGLANFGEAPPLQEALVIRDCMKAQGFEYVPVDPAAQKAASTGGLTSAQKRTLYGYGITTRYGQARTPSPPDPNSAIRAALSPANKAAYDQALNGTVPSTNSGGGGGGGGGGGNNGGGSFRTVGGCTRQAIQKVYGGGQIFDQLISRLHAEQQQVDNDQRVVKAYQAWSQCMSAAGYHYTKPSKIKKDLKKRLKALVGNAPSAPGSPPPAGLAALQKLEMSLSRTDFACNTKVHLTATLDKVQAEYDAAFRQQNAPLLSRVNIPAAKG